VIGKIPAVEFVWPNRWESISITRRDQKGALLMMDDGSPALGWTATYIVCDEDGKRTRIGLPQLSGLCRADTPFCEIEDLAVSACRDALEQAGAVE